MTSDQNPFAPAHQNPKRDTYSTARTDPPIPLPWLNDEALRVGVSAYLGGGNPVPLLRISGTSSAGLGSH